jgi:hypothetical protein
VSNGRRITDKERVLAYLEEHGEVTSYEIRIKGLSGNPSQRINELEDDGHKIDAEPFRRDGRPCVLYKLRQDCAAEGPRGAVGVESSAAGTASSRGGSSADGGTQPTVGTSIPAAATSGRGHQEAQGGGGSRAAAALPTLFELPRSGSAGHYGSEAA